MVTFHLFPRLPVELRLQIWEMTVESRIFNIQYCRSSRFFFSSTPIPGPLQTCREARNAELYQRAFSELPEQEKKKKTAERKIQKHSYEEHELFLHRCSSMPIIADVYQDDESLPADYERRYFWLNLDIDMVDIGETYISIFEPVAHTITRLRFTRDHSDEFWYHTEVSQLRVFSNVSEIHVVLCRDGDMQNWHGTSLELSWPRGSENVMVVDSKAGCSMKLMDLEDKFDRWMEEVSRENGWAAEFCCREIVRYLDEEGSY